MARRRDINDIDDDEDGLFDYSGDSNDDKSKDILPEDAFRHRQLILPNLISIPS